MKPFLTVVGALLIAACATIRLDGSMVPQSTGENLIWDDGRDEEEAIRKSGFVINDPEVEAYLQSVVSRLVEAEGLDPEFFTVSVIRDASLNAFALPHGAMFIHSGLVARMTNEAQLAAVIGHEITHITHHHARRGIKDQRAKSTMLAVATVSAGDYGGLVGLLGGLGAMASVSGYSRALETEADEVGWKRMLNAGYNTDAAPGVFRMLMADLERDRRNEPFFFGTHPRLKDREKNFARMNAGNKQAVGNDLGEDRFARGILPILAINGEMELLAGRWTAARDQLWRYRLLRPDDPRARWLIGETERRAGAQGDPVEARQLLGEALAIEPNFAPAHRSLGLIHYKARSWKSAAHHLRLYLELDTQAIDRAYLEAYLTECERALASSSIP